MKPARRAFPSHGSRPGGALRRRLPLDPRRPFGVARVALPSDSLGLHTEPLRPSKARTTLARPQGDGCGPSPCDPLGRRLRRCGRCRGSGVHRRRPARGAAARQGGNPIAHAPSPRGPPPVKGPHGTPHKPPRGARGLVEVAVQTPDGQRPPAAAFARAKATRGGVARGTRKGRCRRRAVRRTQMGYYAWGTGEIKFASKEELEAAVKALKKIPASANFKGIEKDYPDHESFEFCKAMSELGFSAVHSKDDFYPYSFDIEYEWDKIGSWTEEPFEAIGPHCVKSYFKWSGEDGERWLESGLHTEKDMLVASFPDGGVECSNGSMFIDLTYADQRFQLFINVNDWGVPTFHISQIK